MSGNLEEIAAKVLGKAKVVKGAIEGLHGVFTTLMEEHGQVTALLLRVKSSSDPQVRRELWPRIRAELLSHEKAELAVVYPAYRAHPEIARIAQLHDQDAGQLEAAITQLHEITFDDPLWNQHFERLVKLVQHHVKEEEVEYFREGNRVFGEQSEQLDEQFKLEKEAVLQTLL